MSKVGQMVMEIQEYIVDGYSNEQIASILKVPLSWVEAEREEMESEPSFY